MKSLAPLALGGVLAAALSAATPPALAASAPLPPVSQRSLSDRGCLAASRGTVPGVPWASRALDLDRTGQLSTGASVTVAVLDTGVSPGGSPQLSGQVTAGLKIVGPANQDCVGHGTFVASLIAAKPQPGTGFAGIAPGAHLFALAVTDRNGDTAPDAIAAAIRAAMAAGARVIDVSVATYAPSANLAAAVRLAVAGGALVVAPSVLDDQSQAAPVYPASYPGVLSVADAGAGGGLPSSEVIGAPVDLVAPGDDVVGIGPAGGYFAGTGASYATAYVAGAAALVDSYLGRMPPARLIHRLEATAVHPGTRLPDPRAGYGEVDPYAAMSMILPEESAASPAAARPGAGPVARAGRLAVPRPPGRAAMKAGTAVAAGSVALVVCVALAALTVVRGRRRGWRPGV